MNQTMKTAENEQSNTDGIESSYGLDAYGLRNLGKIYWNLSAESLNEQAILRGEGILAQGGALSVRSGEHTARAARDKYIVDEPSSTHEVDWGEYNQPMSSENFNGIFGRIQAYLQGRDVFVQDCYAGAVPEYRRKFRIITEDAWQSMFAVNMFSQPESRSEYLSFIPDFTIIAVPAMRALPAIDNTRSGTVITMNFAQKIAVVVGSGYGGEIKKTAFTVMNYLLPKEGVLPMHCSASLGTEGDTALYFGLSGTGKTTLSADTRRGLIGDDEHGWSDRGIFNFEDGCYAKVIRLSAEDEPYIYACTHRYGTILENVIMDPHTRIVDLDDDTITPNTRASYPLRFIENAVMEKAGPHPKNIIFLTADAWGVMPPIARLSPVQAIYHFISGYTSKTGGTEAGIGSAPEVTFSACFGAPFMVHSPTVYADLLRRKIETHDVTCWLLNTGWVGGAYGVGERIRIRYTRALLDMALRGELAKETFVVDPVFSFEVPTHCTGVPDEVLDPASSWRDKEEYFQHYRELAARFIGNFQKFAGICPPNFLDGGPKLP